MMKQEDMIIKAKTWKTVYPHYLDSTLSQQEGRRVSKAVGVPNITIMEMAKALEKVKVPVVVEVHKSYPRETMIKGRVKVMLFDESKGLVNPSVPSKKVLYAKICEYVKQLDDRIKNPNGKPHPFKLDQIQKMEEEKKEVPVAQKQEKGKSKKGKK
ncbi:hypothetical protein ABPG74_012277 [Tetrahymena malaccensis]